MLQTVFENTTHSLLLEKIDRLYNNLCDTLLFGRYRSPSQKPFELIRTASVTKCALRSSRSLPPSKLMTIRTANKMSLRISTGPRRGSSRTLTAMMAMRLKNQRMQNQLSIETS